MISEYTAEFMEGVEFASSPCEMEGVEFSSSSGPMEGIELTSESSSSVSPQVHVEDLASSIQDVHMEDVFLTDKLPAETSGAEKSPVMFKSLRPGPDGKLLKRPYQDELEYAMDRIKRRRIDNDIVLVCLSTVTAKSLWALQKAQQASSAGAPASGTSVAPPSGSGPGLASGVPSGTQGSLTTAAQVAPAPASAPVQTPQPSSCAASSDLRTAQSDDVPAGFPQPAMETGLAPVVSTTTSTTTTTTDNDETSCVSSAPAAAPAPAVPMQDASAVVAPVVASSAGSLSVTDVVAMTGDSAVSTARLASHEVEMSVPAGGSSEWDVEIDGSVCAEWMPDAEVAFGADVDGGSSAGDVEMGSSSAPAACNRPTTTGPSSAASFGSSTVSFSSSASSASSRLFSSVAASSSVSSSAFSAGSSTSSFSLSRPAQVKKSAGSSDATAVSSTSSAALPAPPPVAPSVLAGAFLQDLANDISFGAPTISGNLSTLGADAPAAGKTKTVENPATTDEAMEESSPEDPDLPDYESLQEDDLPDYESVQGDFPNEAATLTVTDDAPATDDAVHDDAVTDNNAVTDADADAVDADADADDDDVSDDDDAVDDDGDAVDSPPALPASYSIPTTSYDFTMFRRLGRRIPHPEWLPELEKMCDSLARGWKYDLGVRDNWEATKDAAHDKDRTPGSFDQECRYFGTAVMAYAKRLEGEQREREAADAQE
ncbi:hypothetical protein DIS24_g9877 [Lasiodiplodia hormozganensis]|uniref:Uncharacterized protein n=1 Tax=Lasiodiplodia hormozganensis TaxID=869390 RepID=A0AA40CIF9_9PEZI|nr:hypothetical protein DIS24_g9877 [Lasiodiplodia hormozganensis]